VRFILSHPLNSSNRVNAFFRYVNWQIFARVLRRKIIVPWVDESKIIISHGETGLTGNFYVGLMEYEDMLFLLHALRKTETFVDIGANVGAYTILASKVILSKSIAFEPLLHTVSKLNEQLYLNKIESRVDVRNIGLSDRNGDLFFTKNNNAMNKVTLAGKTQNSTLVKVSTLDHELTDDTQYFLKIDVEGFEYNVIMGASKILRENNVVAIIIELNGSGQEFGHSDEEIHQKLLGFNFIPVTYDPFIRKLIALKSFKRGSGNTIYVKNLDFIAQRCKSAPMRTIHTAWDLKI
jgi:FkbM family methyltransferase